MKDLSSHTLAAIEQWRSNLLQSGRFNTEELDELQCHLQDELEMLKALNITDDEKFMIASHRLGCPTTLKKAYSNTKLFNFDRISMIIQVILGLFIFQHLNKISTFITVDLFGTNGSEATLLYLCYWGLQLTAMFGAFLLIRYLLKLSLQKGRILKANLIAVASVCLSASAVVVYALLSPQNGVMTHPLVTHFIPNLAYIVILVLFAVFTLKEKSINREIVMAD